jgi:predicted GNAT family N-acyltransferase
MQIHVIEVPWASHKDKLVRIRDTVFAEEQSIARELDQDGQDPDATHILAVNEAGQEIACARLLNSGKIGRMAVLKEWRNQGVGARLLDAAVTAAKDQGLTRVFLDAQLQAASFYQKHGFIHAGQEFLEANIPHRPMEMALPIPFEAPAEVPKARIREQLASSDSEKAVLQHHRGERECRTALVTALAEPLRSVNIYSPFLDHTLFDSAAVAGALSSFVRRGAPARTRILIHSSDLVVGRGHRLLELARRMESKIEIRRVPEELASDSHTYVTSDRTSYWLMPDFREYDGLSNSYDPVQANRLDERFEYLWQRSQTDPELRTLKL